MVEPLVTVTVGLLAIAVSVVDAWVTTKVVGVEELDPKVTSPP
jgi:hypothetical protein